MHIVGAALVLAVTAGTAAAQTPGQSSTGAAPQVPAQPPRPPAGAQVPRDSRTSDTTSTACPAPVPPATLPARSFTASTGLILYQVQPTRVADFETLLAYLKQALETTTNPTLRSQASGWTMFRVAEPGPNGDVLYAFLIDPAVPCVDYALGPILAEAYPDPAQLQDIWKLYTGSVRSGGTLMNFVPVTLSAPPSTAPPTTSTTTTPEATPSAPGQAPPVPLDANPVRRP